jgi:integrase
MRTVHDWFEAWPRVAPALRSRSGETIGHTRTLAGSFERRFGRRLLDGFEHAGAECLAWAAQYPQHVRYARTILSDAVLAGVLSASPLRGARYAPRAHRGEYVPDMDEVLALAEEGERFGMRELVLVAACSGGRLSALAALEAGDIALAVDQAGLLRLQLARKRHVGRYPALVLQPGAQELMWLQDGAEGRQGRVFSRAGDRAWCRRSVSRAFVQMRATVGLPGSCTFHALRKTYATRLLDMGMSDMDVAFALDHVDALGRPNPEQVRLVYGRPSRDEALARIARAA